MILEQVCNDVNCDESQCMLRHPNPCFWGIRCTFNKRGECLYSHVTFASCDDNTIKAHKTDFNDQLGKMENQVKLLQIDLEKKDSKIILLEGKCKSLGDSMDQLEEKCKKSNDRMTIYIYI